MQLVPPRARLQARIYKWEAPGFTATLQPQPGILSDRDQSPKRSTPLTPWRCQRRTVPFDTPFTI